MMRYAIMQTYTTVRLCMTPRSNLRESVAAQTFDVLSRDYQEVDITDSDIEGYVLRYSYEEEASIAPLAVAS